MKNCKKDTELLKCVYSLCNQVGGWVGQEFHYELSQQNFISNLNAAALDSSFDLSSSAGVAYSHHRIFVIWIIFKLLLLSLGGKICEF